MIASKSRPGRRVAANHEFLTLVHAHFLPGALALPRLVAAIDALGYSLRALRFHGADQIEQARLRHERLADRLAKVRKARAGKEFSPTREVPPSRPGRDDQQVEHVIQNRVWLEPCLCNALKLGLPEPSSATISPSMTVRRASLRAPSRSPGTAR
jgi:hypothetical protein